LTWTLDHMSVENHRPAGATVVDTPDRPARRLMFIATEDWFFASHYLPMARAAREIGLDVIVVARVRKHRAAIEAAGATVINLDAERASLNPLSIASTVAALTGIIRRERPAAVQCVALRSILLGGIAARLAGCGRRIYFITGLGFLGARRDFAGRVARTALSGLLRGPLNGPQTQFLFENDQDPGILGLGERHAHAVTVVGGAGVAPEQYIAEPQPAQPPLRIAIVSRMLWSKGLDLAVSAVRRARAQGFPVELSLYGSPDPSNPRAVPEETLQSWNAEPGVCWAGPTTDVSSVWRSHQVCCLPSRGGEGLPRTLLEGAICGRAIVTTSVPGCSTLVRDGVEGLIVPPDDSEALADAFIRLARNPALTMKLGNAARERVLSGFTEHHTKETTKRLYRRVLALESA
jgi:glycosyltransferase involved in cell wall biosynthesis